MISCQSDCREATEWQPSLQLTAYSWACESHQGPACDLDRPAARHIAGDPTRVGEALIALWVDEADALAVDFLGIFEACRTPSVRGLKIDNHAANLTGGKSLWEIRSQRQLVMPQFKSRSHRKQAGVRSILFIISLNMRS